MAGLLYTIEQAAMRLGLSVKTVRAFARAGSLNFIPVGEGKTRQRRMFSESNLEMFVSDQSRIGSPPRQAAIRKHDKMRTSIADSGVTGVVLLPSGRTPNSKALTDKWESAAAKKLYKNNRSKKAK